MATSTFYPDPHVESASFDGRAYRNPASEAWATIRAGAGLGIGDDGATMTTTSINGSTTSNEYGLIARGFYLFDTSSIPNLDTISAATFSLYGSSRVDGLSGQSSANSALVLSQATTASNTGGTASDYNNTHSNHTTNFGESVTQTNWNDSAYNVITLNASGLANISKTSVSKFATRAKWDFDNTETGLTWASSGAQTISVIQSETAGTGSDPKLVVTHATAFTPTIMMS